MTREECVEEIAFMAEDYDIINRITAGLNIKAYIDSLEQRITELEAPKSCDGCKHIEEMGSCYDCSRYYIDYYEPKDK